MSILIGGIDEHGVYLAADKRAVNARTKAAEIEDAIKIHTVNDHIAVGVVGHYGVSQVLSEFLQWRTKENSADRINSETFADVQQVIQEMMMDITRQYQTIIEQRPFSVVLAGIDQNGEALLSRWDSDGTQRWRDMKNISSCRLLVLGPPDLPVEFCNHIAEQCVAMARTRGWPLLSAMTSTIGVLAAKSSQINDKVDTWTHRLP